MEFIVDSVVSLEQLRNRSSKSTIRRIRLAGPLADEGAERALNHAYFACGCEYGSFTVVAVLACSVLFGLLRGFDGPFVWWCILLSSAKWPGWPLPVYGFASSTTSCARALT